MKDKSYDYDDDIRSSVSQQRGGSNRKISKMPTYDCEDDDRSVMSHRSSRKASTKLPTSNRGRGSTINDDTMSTYSRKSSLKSGGSKAGYRNAQSPARSRVRFSQRDDSDEDDGAKSVGSIMDKYLSK